MKRDNVFSIALTILMFATLTAACRAQPDAPTVQLEGTPAVLTDIPTAQPTQEKAPLAIIINSEESAAQQHSEIVESIRTQLEPLGWQVELSSEVPPVEAEESPSLVVALPPGTGAADLASVNPEVQFIAVGAVGLQAGGNLSVISGSADAAALVGFVAGYTAAAMTEDWRIGVISSNTAAGQQHRDGFNAGARYFCGLCLQTYPPYYEYPLSAEVPAGASPEQLQSAANQLIGQSVRTIYLPADVGNAALYENLSQAGIMIIGGAAPADPKPGTWAATLVYDYPASVARAIEAFLAGEPSSSFSATIHFVDINFEILSRGIIEHIQPVIDDLLEGWIQPVEAAP